MPPTYTKQVISHRVLYLEMFSTSSICIIYLHLTEGCVEVTIAMFIFAIRKILKILRKIFSTPSLYILEKKFPC